MTDATKITRPPITQDELTLLTTPDADLQKQAFVDSFDQKRFVEHALVKQAHGLIAQRAAQHLPGRL